MFCFEENPLKIWSENDGRVICLNKNKLLLLRYNFKWTHKIVIGNITSIQCLLNLATIRRVSKII